MYQIERSTEPFIDYSFYCVRGSTTSARDAWLGVWKARGSGRHKHRGARMWLKSYLSGNYDVVVWLNLQGHDSSICKRHGAVHFLNIKSVFQGTLGVVVRACSVHERFFGMIMSVSFLLNNNSFVTLLTIPNHMRMRKSYTSNYTGTTSPKQFCDVYTYLFIKRSQS